MALCDNVYFSFNLQKILETFLMKRFSLIFALFIEM